VKSFSKSGIKLFQIVPAEPKPWTSTRAGLDLLVIATVEVMLTTQLWMISKKDSQQKPF
jgi:hypothetical protein